MDAVRRQIREHRRALDDEARSGAAEAAAALVLPLLGEARTLGAYLAVAGEVDAAPVMRWAWPRGCRVFVPRVAGSRTMVFAELTPDSRRQAGACGVPEPAFGAPILAASRLDAVLVPLVAFDRTGTRLGTGAGFYDRAFSFRLDQPRGSAPLLIGLAYSWQELDHIDRRAWDVPLDHVVTEREVITPAT